MATIDTYEKITVDMLTTDSVSILRRTFATINDEETQIGDNWRRSYINSEAGRLQISEELEEPYLSSVMQVWGDTPTVEELSDEITTETIEE